MQLENGENCFLEHNLQKHNVKIRDRIVPADISTVKFGRQVILSGENF
jgi:hypothetical protein